jgi:hypothetical protein
MKQYTFKVTIFGVEIKTPWVSWTFTNESHANMTIDVARNQLPWYQKYIATVLVVEC